MHSKGYSSCPCVCLLASFGAEDLGLIPAKTCFFFKMMLFNFFLPNIISVPSLSCTSPSHVIIVHAVHIYVIMHVQTWTAVSLQ